MKPRPVWVVEVRGKHEREWYPRYDSGCHRTKKMAEIEAHYQGNGAMHGVLEYRPAKYVRVG